MKKKLFALLLLFSSFQSYALVDGYCYSKERLFTANGCLRTDILSDASVIVKAFPATNANAGTLKKKLLFVSGYDAEGVRTYDDYLNILNVNGNLIDKLRNDGFDVVVANFEASSRYGLGENGWVLSGLIGLLNGYSPEDAAPTVVLGWSMGGVIARMALNTLEQFGAEHNVGTYISFDAPHRGAHIPTGIQRIPKFLSLSLAAAQAELDDLEDLLDLVNLSTLDVFTNVDRGISALNLSQTYLKESATTLGFLTVQYMNNPSASEMLINHYEYPFSHPDRNVHMQRLSVEGYPEKTRNVAFTNGSVHGNRNPEYPLGIAIPLLSYDSNIYENVSIDLNIKSTQAQSPVLVGEMRGPDASILGVLTEDIDTYHYEEIYTFSHVALDGVPGSWIDTLMRASEILNEQVGDTFGEVDPLVETHTFIPTISALDIDIGDYNANLLALAGENDLASITPFDVVYYPSDGQNERHETITTEKSNQLYQEITRRNDLVWLVPIITYMVL